VRSSARSWPNVARVPLPQVVSLARQLFNVHAQDDHRDNEDTGAVGRASPSDRDRTVSRERLSRQARRARLRRRRLLAGLAGLLLVAGGVLAVVRIAGDSTPAPASAPPTPRYRGGKLAPQPSPRVTRPASGLPTEAEQLAAVRRLLRLGHPILCAGGRGRYIALTFDDGPGPYTPLMLRMLRKRGLRATFFLVGSRVEIYRDLPRQQLELAALGNHSWSHPYLPGLSAAEIDSQLRGTRELIRRTSGRSVLLFRPPYGAHDPDVDRIARELGMLQILWSVDSGDSTGADVEGVARNVSAGLKPGAIVLLHENRATTIKSLIRYVFPEIRRKRLRAVSVPELLALDPPTASQVRSGEC